MTRVRAFAPVALQPDYPPQSAAVYVRVYKAGRSTRFPVNRLGSGVQNPQARLSLDDACTGKQPRIAGHMR